MDKERKKRNSKQQKMKEDDFDSTIHQSRKDQILIYQMQRIHNSKQFESFTYHNEKINTHV